MNRARITLLVVMTCLFAVAATAQVASGATLSRSAGFKMSSVSVQGTDVYWFQRAKSFKLPRSVVPLPPTDTTPPSTPYIDPDILDVPSFTDNPGRILHRKLGSAKVSVVYKPPKGMRIAGYAARSGRLVVGLQKIKGPNASSIVELTGGGSVWTSKVLVERIGGEREGRCGAKVLLMNVNRDGDVIYDDAVLEGHGGKCEIVRRRSTYKRLDRAGVTTDLVTSHSGWSLNPDELNDFYFRAGAGDWFARFVSGGGLLGVFNVVTGETSDTPMTYSSDGRIEVTAEGDILRQAFDAEARRFFTLTRTPTNPTTNFYFKRSRYTTWFHLCGDKVLEIARKRGKQSRRRGRERGAGRYWHLYLRSQDGTVERKLPGKLPRSTGFNGCNADTALFSRTVRNGRVRQTSVSLGP